MIKRNLLVMGLAVLLSACGFQLRGTGTNEMSIKEIDLSARNAYGETVRQLRQTLESSGVKVYTGAPYKLYLADEQESQRILSYAGAGRTGEYQVNTCRDENDEDKYDIWAIKIGIRHVPVVSR